MGVIVVVACLALLGAGLALVWRWDGEPVRRPWSGWVPAGRERAARYLWWLAVGWSTVLVTAVTVVGPGGRLAMRLLGATAGDRAQGRLTEAEEVVGEITIEGTVGFFLFVGVLGALLTTVVWFLLRRWLPGGRLAGLLFGVGLLVVLTRSEPLRRDNSDFDLLGPGWLSVVVFTALALLQGIAVPAVAARQARWLPLVTERGSWRRLAYLPLVLFVPLWPLGFLAVAGGVLAWWGPELTAPAWWRSRQLLVGGRAVLVLVVLVALPSFAGTVADILSRGP